MCSFGSIEFFKLYLVSWFENFGVTVELLHIMYFWFEIWKLAAGHLKGPSNHLILQIYFAGSHIELLDHFSIFLSLHSYNVVRCRWPMGYCFLAFGLLCCMCNLVKWTSIFLWNWSIASFLPCIVLVSIC
jgi:hypothetical protein